MLGLLEDMWMQGAFTKRSTDQELSPVIATIIQNDVEALKRLIETFPESLSVVDKRGENLLEISVRTHRYDIFSYLLSLDHYGVETIKKSLRRCLIYYDLTKERQPFAVDLVNKSPNLHVLDRDKNSYLHLAMKQHYFKVAEILIERGLDINARNTHGCTPFHMLFCEKRDPMAVIEGVGLLLYYGVDASICDNNKYLPFDLLVLYERNELVQVREILFNYTFDEYSEYTVSVEVLFELLESQSELLFEIANLQTNVVFHKGVVINTGLLLEMPLRFLRLMIDKFSSFVSRVFLSKSAEYCYTNYTPSLQNWDMLLQSPVGLDVVQYITELQLDLIIDKLTCDGKPPREIHDTAFFLVSYGIYITAEDLDLIYNLYGYCTLFKTLLHMDIDLFLTDIFPHIIYDVCLDLDYFLDNPRPYSERACTALLYYFAKPKLKNHILMSREEKFLEKARSTPNVPSLVEFARDATRKFLVEKFKLETSREFYWLLNRLPIGTYQKRILSFETKLYP